MGRFKRAARGLLWPVRRLLDPRFKDIKRHIAMTRQDIASTHAALEEITAEVNRLVGSYAASGVEAMSVIGGQLRTLEAEIEELRIAPPHLRLDPLDRAAEIRERIVELPFALQALGALASDARVLVLGGSETTLALSLASLGHHVTVLGVGEYPYRHPRLESVVSPIEHWAGTDASYDAVICIGYGDHAAVGRIADVLRAGGLLVLTIAQRAVERRNDPAAFDELLGGWDVSDRRVIERADDGTWQPAEDSHGDAVALVVARKPAE